MNRSAPEWLYWERMVDERIDTHRRRLESESTPAEELALERAKLRALITLKNATNAEEAT